MHQIIQKWIEDLKNPQGWTPGKYGLHVVENGEHEYDALGRLCEVVGINWGEPEPGGRYKPEGFYDLLPPSVHEKLIAEGLGHIEHHEFKLMLINDEEGLSAVIDYIKEVFGDAENI